MKRKLHNAVKLAEDIKKANKRLRAIPFRSKTALAREVNDAHGPPQLTTGGGPLPLRTVPICEFCYLSMRPTDQSHYCIEHDMGGHTNCYKLHETTVHQ